MDLGLSPIRNVRLGSMAAEGAVHVGLDGPAQGCDYHKQDDDLQSGDDPDGAGIP
jgi:hypothetical protein